MTTTVGLYFTLLRRGIERLMAERIAVVSILFAIALLATGSIHVMESFSETQTGEAARALSLRQGLWTSPWAVRHSVLVAFISAFLGCTQIPGDLKKRTLFGVLSGPVSRMQVFVSGWIASALLVAILELLRSGSGLVAVTLLEGRVDARLILAVCARVCSALLVMALFGAMGAMCLSSGYAALGGTAVLVVSALAQNEAIRGLGAAVLRTVACVTPLPGAHQQVIVSGLLGTEPGLLPLVEAIAYRAIWVVLLLSVGGWVLERRDLAA